MGGTTNMGDRNQCRPSQDCGQVQIQPQPRRRFHTRGPQNLRHRRRIARLQESKGARGIGGHGQSGDEKVAAISAKNDITNVHQVTIDVAHAAKDQTKTTILQRVINVGHAISTETGHLLHNIKCDSKHVQFKRKHTIATFYDNYNTTMLTYDSGADRHYLNKKDRKKVGLPIFPVSANKVGVENGGAYNGKYITKLLFTQLSNKAVEADTFK